MQTADDFDKEEKIKKPNKILKFFKIFAITILIIILLFVGIVLGGYLYIRHSIDKTQKVEIDKNTIEVNEGVKENLTGFKTIALFGVDSRENKLEKGTRSDCIILAIIDQSNKKVNLVSVYRDTYLQITGRNLDKVTHAYAFGGASMAMSTLNTNLDLNITEFATVNFDSMVDIVDQIGGVEITIEPSEIKYINNYIKGTSATVGKASSEIKTAGTYNLDGVQAVAYSRIRYTEGGDYKRTERMRTVLMAVAEKAKKLSVGDLNSFANVVLPRVYTNISTDEIMSLIPEIASYSFEKNIGWPYEVKGDMIGGVWYGVPVTLEESVEKLHKEVLGKEDYVASEKVKKISQAIIDKTGYR